MTFEFTVVNPEPVKPTYHELKPGKLFRHKRDGQVFLIILSWERNHHGLRWVNLRSFETSGELPDRCISFPTSEFEEVIPAGSIELRRL